MDQGSIKVDGNTNVTVNEYGNISKVITTNVISDLPVEHEHTFYYRIEKEAGLSMDEQTGEQFPVYCHIHIRYENEMSEDTLHHAHHAHYVLQISDEHGIDVAHITPITKENYEKGMEG